MNVLNKTKQIFSVAATQIKHYKPEICHYGGGVLILAGLVKGYSAGKKIAKKNIAETYKARIEEIDKENTGAGPESKKQRGREKRKATAEVIVDNAGTILVPIALTATGLLLEHIAFKDVKNANKVLVASLASIAATNKAIQENVEATYGPEALDISKTGGHYEPVEKKYVDENGEAKTKTEQMLVLDDGSLLNPELGDSFVYSEQTVKPFFGFIDNEDNTHKLVADACAWANRKIKDIDGYVFNEDIVTMFGIETRPQDHTNGKVFDYDDPMHNTGYSLKCKEIRIKNDDGTLSRGWLITPNSEPIIDIYPKFSLHKLIKRS